MVWSTLSDRMLRTCLAVMGEPVVYRRAGVETTIKKATFSPTFQTVDPETGAPIQSTQPLLALRAADIPGGEAQEGDEVQVRGVWYQIGEPQPDAEGLARLVLHK